MGGGDYSMNLLLGPFSLGEVANLAVGMASSDMGKPRRGLPDPWLGLGEGVGSDVILISTGTSVFESSDCLD